jgi:hypothetical protein
VPIRGHRETNRHEYHLRYSASLCKELVITGQMYLQFVVDNSCVLSRPVSSFNDSTQNDENKLTYTVVSIIA